MNHENPEIENTPNVANAAASSATLVTEPLPEPIIYHIPTLFIETVPNDDANAPIGSASSAAQQPVAPAAQHSQVDQAGSLRRPVLADIRLNDVEAQVRRLLDDINSLRVSLNPPPLNRNNLGSPIPEGIPNTGNDPEILRLHTNKHVYECNEHQLSSLDDSMTAETCPLCYAIYTDGDLVRRLPCFHLFHTTCADPWLAEKLTCPICRTKIIVTDI